jgi:WD40 repeat protein
MRLQHALVVTAAVSLWLVSLLLTPATAFGAEFTPHKESLAIPVSVAGKPADSVRCVVTLGPTAPVSAVAFSPDGKTLAAAGYQEVLIWDLENATLSKRIGTGQMGSTIGALAFLKDGQLAVGEGTPYESGAVKVFDVETGKQTHSFEEPGEVVYSLAVSPDGKLLAAGGADALARVWNVDDKRLVATLEKHTDWVLGVSFSRDGKLLATASADKNVWVWDTATWESSVKLREDEAVHGAAFASDAKNLLVAVGGPSRRAVSFRRTDNVRSRRPNSTGAGIPLGVVGALKANRVYVPCSDGAVRVHDGRNGRLLATLSGHEDWVYCVALSSDETKVASGSGDGTVKLWNVADGRLLATLVQLAPGTDEWLVITAQGYLATSGPDSLQWNAKNLKTPLEELTQLLQKPESVQQVIAGDKVEPPAIK